MRVMVGTVIMRAEDGSCLPGGTPIYRDLPEREGLTEPEDYYDFDDFALIMADKYESYLCEKRKAALERKKRKEKRNAEKEDTAIRDTDSGRRRYETDAH